MIENKCKICGVETDSISYSGLCPECERRLAKEGWENPIPVCPQCGKESLRWLGDLCLRCAVENKSIDEINRLSRKAVNLAKRGEELPKDVKALGDLLQGFDD